MFWLNVFAISNCPYRSLDTARSLGGFAVCLFLEVLLIKQKRDHPIAKPQNQVSFVVDLTFLNSDPDLGRCEYWSTWISVKGDQMVITFSLYSKWIPVEIPVHYSWTDNTYWNTSHRITNITRQAHYSLLLADFTHIFSVLQQWDNHAIVQFQSRSTENERRIDEMYPIRTMDFHNNAKINIALFIFCQVFNTSTKCSRITIFCITTTPLMLLL